MKTETESNVVRLLHGTKRLMKTYEHQIFVPSNVGPQFIGVVQHWYDPHIRCWTVVALDWNEDQIDEALYCAGGRQNDSWLESNRKEAEQRVKTAWQEEANR